MVTIDPLVSLQQVLLNTLGERTLWRKEESRVGTGEVLMRFLKNGFELGALGPRG